jgi:hypothetical protein
MNSYPLVSKLPICQYGSGCKRANPNHWQTNQHPNHPKPIIAPDALENMLRSMTPSSPSPVALSSEKKSYSFVSELPVCQYGADCKRQNIGHWKAMQHPGHTKPVIKPSDLEEILKKSAPLPESNGKDEVASVVSSDKNDDPSSLSMVSSLPVCKFRDKCTRQNIYHWETTRHPGHTNPVIKPTDLELKLTGTDYDYKVVKQRVPMEKIVSYILGMDEMAFRTLFKFDNTIASYERSSEQIFKDAGIENPNQWFEEWPLRKLIMYSKTSMKTISDLKKSVGKPPKNSTPVKFTIQVLDPHDPEKCNVAHISSLPENNGATFQVATASALLEGRSGNPDATLSGCAEHPVQGEFAMFSTAASYIARKYLKNPEEEMDDDEDYYKFPWKNIFGPEGTGYTVPDGPTPFSIKYDSDKLPKISPELVDSTSIGLCENAPVSFGMIVDKKDPIKHSMMKAVQPEEMQFVHHALTPAFNIGKMLKGNVPKTEIEKLNGVAETILHAAYMGTVLAAASFKSKKVFLTLVGGSAFRNPISFIANAINQVFDSGYANLVDEIVLVFHPARMKWIKDASPMRSPEIDKKFFAALKPIADNKQLIDLLGEYTDLMYGSQHGELPSDNIDKASSLATKINFIQK